ncbi:MAG: BREX-1 system phosphatase PglZ type A [Bacteroidota bacterium]
MSAIQDRLSEQFTTHRLIFWYDAGGELEAEFEQLELPGVELLRLQNNEFGLRHRLTRREPEQRFLIYSPEARPQDEDNWLLDLLLAHHQFHTDKVAMSLRELNLSLDFREVVADHLAFFNSQGRREKLARLLQPPPQSPQQLPLFMVAVVLGQQAPHWEDMLLTLLQEEAMGESRYWVAIKKYGLDAALWEEMQQRYGYQSKTPGLRDFVVLLFRQAMNMAPEEEGQKPLRREAQVFLKRWQDSQRYRIAFETLSKQMEVDLDIAHDLVSKTPDELMEMDVFRAIDRQLIHQWCGELVSQTIDPERLQALVQGRRQTFWFEPLQHPYLSLYHASELLLLLRKLEIELDSLGDGLRHYVEQYHQVDQQYRKFCLHFQQLQADDRFQELGDWIDRQYQNEFLEPLSRAWQQQLQQVERWELTGLPSQRDFYARWVQPFLERDNKIYVIISDALRYEIGVELAERINREDRYTAEVDACYGVLPSYTQLGMAALLPHAQLEMEADKTTVLADGNSATGIANRGKILSKQHDSKGTALTQQHLMDLSQDKGREIFRHHEVIYIYHNVIDDAGDDTGSEAKVFQETEKAIEELILILKKIARFNGSNMLITADHGFLFQRKALEDADFSAWEKQGKVVKHHRRFVIGQELGQPPHFLKFDFAQLGLEGEGEVLFPPGRQRLRVKGAGSQFVHGGTSLQEIVLPVIRVNKKRETDLKYVEVDLLGSNRKITTNQVSVRLYQTDPTATKLLPRELEIGFYSEEGVLLSEKQRHRFDSNATDARKREIQLRFGFIKEANDYQGKDIYLTLKELIPGTNQMRVYRSIPFRVFISMAPDF